MNGIIGALVILCQGRRKEHGAVTTLLLRMVGHTALDHQLMKNTVQV